MPDRKRESAPLQPVPISVVDQRHTALRMAIIGNELLAADPDTALIADLRGQPTRQQDLTGGSPRDVMEADEIFHPTLAYGAGKGIARRAVVDAIAEDDLPDAESHLRGILTDPPEIEPECPETFRSFPASAGPYRPGEGTRDLCTTAPFRRWQLGCRPARHLDHRGRCYAKAAPPRE